MAPALALRPRWRSQIRSPAPRQDLRGPARFAAARAQLRRVLAGLCLTALLAAAGATAGPPIGGPTDRPTDRPADEPVRRVLEPLSGSAFQPDAVQALQRDPFANPGLLWLDEGLVLYASPAGREGRSCADCHGADGDALRGAAASYPRFDASVQRLVNIEQRINACRVQHQDATPLDYESEGLLALTTFVANLSVGKPVAISIDGPARPHFEAGQDYYYRRRGQLNLACQHCHEQNWGKMLRGDRLSQGHGTGYPAYRLEWQTLGSLHRRFRACNLAIRAEPQPYGAEAYVDLELFLAWRAAGLPVESPAVRR